MAKFRNKDLAELAHQLTLSPKRQRLAQIQGIERLLASIGPEKSYPYDMVCFQVTGYRNRRNPDKWDPDKCIIPGDVLVSDLVTLAEHITRRTAIPVADIDGEICTHEELAQSLSVSTKTVRRWRRRGLMGFRAQLADGVSRLVYLRTTVERFKSHHRDLVERGAAFRQLSRKEKEQIVAQATEILAGGRKKLHVVARQIAEKTGRAVETVRYTLRRHDEANPGRALFTGGHPLAPPGHRVIWQAHQNGRGTDEIAVELGIETVEVLTAIRQMRVRQLKAEPIAYVYNELFDAPNADRLILNVPRPPADTAPKRVRPPRELPAYLRSLYYVPLMTGDQEADAFRRYNYLKHKAARMVEALDVATVTQGQLDMVDAAFRAFEAIRQEIVQANLRLVVSIAKRHVGWSAGFFETVSDGNISLMRAVEKFDYSRGYKFSTYASWAIMKNFARTVPEKHYHLARYVTGQDELLERTADQREPDAPQIDEQSLAAVLENSMDQLTERERTIVTNHFGLFGASTTSTLEELGRQYGVTKERIRQIERRAMGKLKAVLSPSLAEMLSD